LNHSKSSVSFQERTVAADNEVMFAAEVEMPEQSVNAEVNGRELSVLQKQNEDSERQMAVSSNHATKPLEADGGQKLYAGRAQDGHFERSYKDKYEQNWTMNLYQRM
jgi:predicted aspartyl protease